MRFFDEISRISGEYQSAKEQIVEESVDALESKWTTPVTIVLGTMVAACWLLAIFRFEGFEEVASEFGATAFFWFFVVSYFFFYPLTKLIVRQNAEELEDKTSRFSLFSANSRKFGRSVVSIIGSVLNTLLVLFYLLNEDLNLL